MKFYLKDQMPDEEMEASELIDVEELSEDWKEDIKGFYAESEEARQYIFEELNKAYESMRESK